MDVRQPLEFKLVKFSREYTQTHTHTYIHTFASCKFVRSNRRLEFFYTLRIFFFFVRRIHHRRAANSIFYVHNVRQTVCTKREDNNARNENLGRITVNTLTATRFSYQGATIKFPIFLGHNDELSNNMTEEEHILVNIVFISLVVTRDHRGAAVHAVFLLDNFAKMIMNLKKKN